MNNGPNPTEPGRDDRHKTAGLFLGAELEISAPPDLPPPAPAPAPTPVRPPSRVQPVMRSSALRASLRPEAPRRNVTTRIVGIVSILAVAVITILALVMMRSSMAQKVRPLPPPQVAVPGPEQTPAPVPVPGPTPAPVDTVTRPLPPPRSGTTAVIRNLVANPSFEQLADGKPVGWATNVYQGAAQFSIAPGHRGGNATCITSTTGGDASWIITVAVKPQAVYLFKGWVRCENLVGARGGQFYLHPLDVRSDAITGTTGWKQLQFSFESHDQSEVTLNCLYGGWGMATGTLWFDDIEVTELFSAH